MKDLDWLEFAKRIYYIFGFIIFVLVCGEASDPISIYMECSDLDKRHLDRCSGYGLTMLGSPLMAIISTLIGPFIGWKLIEWVLTGLKKKAD